MMRVVVFASGSSGNCMLVSGADTHVLIDAGISMRRTQAALSQAGLSLHDIGGVLITHEHSDHICALPMLVRHFRMPVYAPRTVAARLRGMLPEIEPFLQVIPVGEPFQLGGLRTRAFPWAGCCAKLARALADSGTARIILGHLSRENNRPELALAAAAKALEGTGAALCCAPVYGCLSVPVERTGVCSR